MTAAKKTAPADPDKPVVLNLDKVIAERVPKVERLRVRLFGQMFNLLPLSSIDLRVFASDLTEAEQALKVIESMMGKEQMAKIPPGVLTADTAAIIVDAVIEAQGESAPLGPSGSTSG